MKIAFLENRGGDRAYPAAAVFAYHLNATA